MNYPKLLSDDMIANSYQVKTVRKTLRADTGNHFHDFFEIELILGGEGFHSANGKVYPIRRGSIFLMTPADFHNLCTTTHLDILTVMFKDGTIGDSLIESLMSKSNGMCFDISAADVERIDFLADMLMKEEESHDLYSRGCIKNLLECILSIFLRYAPSDEAKSDEETVLALDKALKYVYAHFRDNPTLFDVARLSGYSPNYFSKIFAEKIGINYSAFLNQLKINLAKMLLISTDETSSQIAFFCGFNSLSNFYRVFAASVGLSPLEYRSANKKM